MDRIIPQVGAIPLAEDHLNAQRSTMIGLGWFMSMVMGTAAAAEGLGCAPTSPPSMAVQINPGMLCQGATIDASQYGSLPLGSDNVSPLVKAGILPSYDPTSMLFTLAAPTVSGQSINYLIEASLLEVDDLPEVLPYYNAANPLVALLGPGGNGTSVFTRRRQKVQLQLKAGVPAVDGFQTTPSADAGWVPLWIITVKFGDTSINSSRIVQHPAAPFIVNKLPQLQPLLGGRIRRVLSTNLNIYVSPTGSNSNDGQTPATPFQTIQQCWDYIQTTLDLNNFGVTINLANGTYTTGFVGTSLPTGFGTNSFVNFVGNNSSPANVIIATTNAHCFYAAQQTSIGVSGVSMGASGGFGGISAGCLFSGIGSAINLNGPVVFRTAAGYHMCSDSSGTIIMSGVNYSISGGAIFHALASASGIIKLQSSAVTLVGTPAFSSGFAGGQAGGYLQAIGLTFSGSASAGTLKYNMTTNSVANTGGSGANYFPGGSAGSVSTGAQYV